MSDENCQLNIKIVSALAFFSLNYVKWDEAKLIDTTEIV